MSELLWSLFPPVPKILAKNSVWNKLVWTEPEFHLAIVFAGGGKGYPLSKHLGATDTIERSIKEVKYKKKV